MLTKMLLRCITFMLAVTEIGFIIMLADFNPYDYKDNSSNIIPTPTFYTADEVENRLKLVEQEPEIVIEHSVTYINAQEYKCLVQNIYFEARNQSFKGKEAIASVTVERVKNKNFPKTFCEVVKERRLNKHNKLVCQFSWFCDNKSDIPNLSSKEERNAWNRARAIAESAVTGKLDIDLNGATHFHADYVKPSWARELTYITTIGDHLFYKES